MIQGLPALASGVIIDAISLITSDAASILAQSSASPWGLFLNGEPVVVADNVLSFDFRQDYRISDYPVEQGSFETYNKVATPFDLRLQFSTGGSVAQRQALIDSVDAIIGSTDLFDAVTPEKTYSSINPVHQSLRRTSHSGVGLLTIDVYCQQIRVTATQQFTTSQQSNSSGTVTRGPDLPDLSTGSSPFIDQPQSPSAAPQISGGEVQPTTPTAAQQTAIGDVLSSPANSTMAVF